MITKPSVLTIQRTDGSSTWAKLHRGLETHDLAHFAVESKLGYTHAFYGIIDKGYNIGDFELPREQRPIEVRPENLHKEAIITEHIVNLLEIELLNSGWNDNFLSELKIILTDNGLSFPEHLNDDTLNEIRTTYHDLYNKWLVLEEGQEISLDFRP